MSDKPIDQYLEFKVNDVKPSSSLTLPKLRSSQSNQLCLDYSDLKLDDGKGILFQGNGQISADGDLNFLANRTIRIATATTELTGKLEVVGTLKLGASLAVKQFSGDIKSDSESDIATVPTVKAVKDYVEGKASPDLPVGSVTTDKIADDAIKTAKIENGAITQEKLAASISFKIQDKSVTAVQLANDAVTADKIKDSSITLAKLDFQISPGSSQWQGADGGAISYSKNNVGIGTANPSAKLHVYSPAGNMGGSIKLFPSDENGDLTYDGGDDSIFGFSHYGNKNGDTRFLWWEPNKPSPTRTLLTIKNTGEVSGNLCNTSSRELKENITDFTVEEAFAALANLIPVKFNFRDDQGKKIKAGFIAEDVPELVASADRKGISALDVVAVLTKVIQQQQEDLFSLKERLNALEAIA